MFDIFSLFMFDICSFFGPLAPEKSHTFLERRFTGWWNIYRPSEHLDLDHPVNQSESLQICPRAGLIVAPKPQEVRNELLIFITSRVLISLRDIF